MSKYSDDGLGMNDALENILLDVSRSPDIDGGDLEKASELILTSALKGLDITRVSIWLLQPDKLSMTAAKLIDEKNHEAEIPVLRKSELPSYFSFLETERTIIANDARNHPATVELSNGYLEETGVYGMLDVPLRHKGEMIGVLCCESRKASRRWTSNEVAFVGMLADIYGRAVSAAERERFEVLLVRQNEQLESMVEERTESLTKALDNFKQAQERLIETEKMAALGKLVAGVAHEVNTPLGVSVTAVTHCEHRLKKLDQAFSDGSISRKQLQTFISNSFEAYQLLSSNLERAATLIQNFKKTAVDQSSFELVVCELNNYLHALVLSLKPMVKKKSVSIKIDCDDTIVLRTYQGALAQIVTNLVSNTNDHAFAEADENHQIHIQTEQEDNGVRFYFRDNGKGMASDTIKNIFEPFFTTSRQTGGSGLGLSIVYNLVTRKLKGEISVQSTPGQGTEFSFFLPDLPK
ncbi:GAF domain-containing sensor histidine kinase [Idiomarina sp. HP20-50]|uniref:GAF domain-containing sensor histidine kinase n=1 Tax=Idiomarina sp. HP20-50 TaxID=3070813 RepID=UPI00294B1CC9|nr:GAF domain-containing sensor histidine kinase [Idiomarina sp. HP20-50]MDV6316161.1 GAF domain-containing sensor histidine kinase [Idiomarina sp. HP20-50]